LKITKWIKKDEKKKLKKIIENVCAKRTQR
jgi:hypothetical protein